VWVCARSWDLRVYTTATRGDRCRRLRRRAFVVVVVAVAATAAAQFSSTVAAAAATSGSTHTYDIQFLLSRHQFWVGYQRERVFLFASDKRRYFLQLYSHIVLLFLLLFLVQYYLFFLQFFLYFGIQTRKKTIIFFCWLRLVKKYINTYLNI